jgi:GTP-binding protein YchF
VKGASSGEGLGNQFLANIRETDAIVYVCRCFIDDDITHVSNKVDPLSDLDVVETELMLADLESLEKRRAGVEKKAKSGDKEAKETLAMIDVAKAELDAGRPARRARIAPEQQKAWDMLQLLTAKPVLYVELSALVDKRAQSENEHAVVISAKIESELAMLPAEERAEFLETLGLSEPGLNRLIRAGYELLGLATYFTVGPKEARAWTIHQGDTAPKAAGVIHTDFEKGFIRAETIAYDDFIKYGGENGAKDAGKMRLEGKDYVVRDGDVMHFRFNA